VVYSFNESKLVTVWSGFSVKWYGALAHNTRSWTQPGCRCRSRSRAPPAPLVIGTIAGYVLSRFTKFRGRTLFAGMVTAPLVMPEIITGISMLLMFVGLEQADRLAGRARRADHHHGAHHLHASASSPSSCRAASPAWTCLGRRGGDGSGRDADPRSSP
jgi:hypothetical protein